MNATKKDLEHAQKVIIDNVTKCDQILFFGMTEGVDNTVCVSAGFDSKIAGMLSGAAKIDPTFGDLLIRVAEHVKAYRGMAGVNN